MSTLQVNKRFEVPPVSPVRTTSIGASGALSDEGVKSSPLLGKVSYLKWNQVFPHTYTVPPSAVQSNVLTGLSQNILAVFVQPTSQTLLRLLS